MKKLMIVAAVAAMASVSLADAQVYNASLSIKTTVAKDGKIDKAVSRFLVGDDSAKGDEITYRKQGTKKIDGIFWGCACETIANPAWRIYYKGARGTIGGYAFWNAKTGDTYYIPNTKFRWLLLNRIDKFTKVEGTWALANNVVGEAFGFVGAGFGSCKNYGNLASLNGAVNECLKSYISKISGNFAGFMEADAGDCIFCRFNVGAIRPFCLCGGVGVASANWTAAYGTWNIKYNSSASKKLEKQFFITGAYNFKGKAAETGVILNSIRNYLRTTAGIALDSDEDFDPEDWDTEDIVGEPCEDDVAAAFTADPEEGGMGLEEPETVDDSEMPEGLAKFFAVVDLS